jgi:hypothetical protein
MSYVIAAPEYVAAAASDLAHIGSSIGAANAAAMTPTSGVLAAGADEVSAMIAALFSTHPQAYQALSALAASFHAQFVQLMNGGASEYALTEAANASPLQTVGQGVLSAVNTPTGAALGTGANSQPGGILVGNGAAGSWANAPSTAPPAATTGPVGFSAPTGPAAPAATVALAPASPAVMAVLPGYSGPPAPAALAGSAAPAAGSAGLADCSAGPAETAATAAPAPLAPAGLAARAAPAGSAAPVGSATAPAEPAGKAGPAASALPATASSQAPAR